MNIVVFGENTKRSIEKTLSILEEIPKEQIREVRKTHSFVVGILTNGDIIRSVTANESSRGIRFEEVHIDVLINRNIIDFIILPSCRENCKIHFFL